MADSLSSRRMSPQKLIRRLDPQGKIRDGQLRTLAELARDGIHQILALEPQHTAESERFKGFYTVVHEIIKHVDTPPSKKSFFKKDPVLKELKNRLKAALPSTPGEAKGNTTRISSLTIAENVAKALSIASDVPILAPMKPIAGVFVHIIELAKTAKSNKEQAAELVCFSAEILSVFLGETQELPGELLGYLKPDIEKFADEIHGVLTELRPILLHQKESSIWRRHVVVKDTRDALVRLRVRIENAHTLVSMSFVIKLSAFTHQYNSEFLAKKADVEKSLNLTMKKYTYAVVSTIVLF